jgi:hypothetical protein
MKKILTFILSAAVLVTLAFPGMLVNAATETTTINLIDKNSGDIIIKNGGGGDIEYRFAGTSLVYEGDSGWPNIKLTFPEIIYIDPANTVVNIKFKLEGSGSTSIRLMTHGDYTLEEDEIGYHRGVYMNHYFDKNSAGEAVYLNDAGDLETDGIYEISIPFSELKVQTTDDAHSGKTDMAPFLNDDGLYELLHLELFSVLTKQVTIEKFELVVTREVEAPAAVIEEAVSEAPIPTPEQTSATPAPQTADPFALIAVASIISSAGIVIARKRK